ncbi:hypothetical protein [Microbacterium sp.]|uniref:hypothetical protein n=1 Tax=Microbacterium sp. TaxID=51671 RepID=UPI002810F667|nr:hypothetical protein [Microbacterium sp.]
MRVAPHVRSAMPSRGRSDRAARLILALGASLALVASLLPAQSASAAAPAPTPTPSATTPVETQAPEPPEPTEDPAPVATEEPEPSPAPEPAQTEAPAQSDVPGPDTEYAAPPVAQVEREDLSEVVAETPLAEEDAAGDVTVDAADPGNVPYPVSGASSGSGDGASSGRFELATPAQAIVPAAAVVGFAPGNIISNSVFTDKNTMTASQIASFINGKVASCKAGYTCLENYKENTRTRAADAYCSRYAGANGESAARIIHKVAQACGINPRVLLVMLQKEQGLITHNWPSDWRFTIAMGMGCPDTADCDKTYYGFFNQVYGAARQMKIYGKSSYFTWYAPGGTRSIRYHPNASCGSSGVYVQNQATANLYYYTPYQPNRAALAAGSGTGDKCSSYGNRNFWNYFRAWFGSTGGGTSSSLNGTLIKAEPHVYLVTGGKKVHITKATLSEYQRIFGAPKTVTAATANSLPNGGEASFYIRNASTGDVSLLQGGQRHHFSSCAQVAAWGSKCGRETVLASAQYTKVPAGSALTKFVRLKSGGQFHLIEGSTLVPLYSTASAAQLNGGKTPYAAVMPTSRQSAYKVGTVRWAPGRFIEPAGSTKTFLPTWDSRLLYVPTWLYPAELGLARVRDDGVPASARASYKASGTLRQFVSCGGTTYLPSRGTLYPVQAAAVRGFPVTALDAKTCGVLRKSTAAPLARVFVQGVGRSSVFVADAGRWRHVASRPVLETLGGGRWPVVHRVAAALADYLPKGSRVTSARPPSGSVIQVRGSDPVYFTDGGKAWWISSWDIGSELGIRGRLAVSSTRTPLKGLAVQSRNHLRPVVSCADGIYVASQGRMYRIDVSGLRGIPGQGMSADTCATLKKGGAVNGRLFVKVGKTTYVADKGTLRALRSGETTKALNGGRSATVLPWNRGTLAFVQAGSR